MHQNLYTDWIPSLMCHTNSKLIASIHLKSTTHSAPWRINNIFNSERNTIQNTILLKLPFKKELYWIQISFVYSVPFSGSISFIFANKPDEVFKMISNIALKLFHFIVIRHKHQVGFFQWKNYSCASVSICIFCLDKCESISHCLAVHGTFKNQRCMFTIDERHWYVSLMFSQM